MVQLENEKYYLIRMMGNIFDAKTFGYHTIRYPTIIRREKPRKRSKRSYELTPPRDMGDLDIEMELDAVLRDLGP